VYSVVFSTITYNRKKDIIIGFKISGPGIEILFSRTVSMKIPGRIYGEEDR